MSTFELVIGIVEAATLLASPKPSLFLHESLVSYPPPPERSSCVSTTRANPDPPESYTKQQAAINMQNRTPGRNVHIDDASDPGMVLGGLLLTNGATTANFYSLVDTVFLFNRDYTLRDESGITVGGDDLSL
ncbi:hypothetical protein B9Z19DRAFT_1136025 [Tuber borchii]|uniref:DUF7881 domain-containing protein n=1 Tax=Tuber borchii TaxID=42251 RepID=A0A2T6ZC02_TUBBO|nr:hypothetical protein B9Z19DRAFT_1136025 [Tuber borchii]